MDDFFSLKINITSLVVFLGYQMSLYICTKCHHSQILLHLLFSWDIRCLCIYVPNAIIPRYYFICCFLGISDVYVYMYQIPSFLDITSFVVFLGYQMSMYICTKCHHSQILLHLLFSWDIRCLCIYVPNAIIPRYYFICCFLGISDVYVYMYQMPSFLDITSFVVFLGYQMSMYICTKCHHSQILLHLLFSWDIRCLCIYVPNAIIPRYYFICFLGISDVYVYMYQMPSFLDITSFVVFLGYQMSMYICTKFHHSQILLHLLFSWDIRCLCIYVPNAIIPRYYFICCFLGISDVYVYMYQMPSFLDITSFVVFLGYQMSMYICTKCHHSQILLHLLFSWDIRCLCIYVPNAIIPRYYFICCFLGISDVYVYMYQMPSFLDITSFVVFLGYQMSMYICTKCHHSQILLHLLFSWDIRCLCIYVPNAIILRYYFICCFLGISDVYVYMYQMPLFLDITSFVVFLEYQMSMYICTKCHYSQILLHLLFSWNIRCLSIYVPNAIIPRYYFICCFLGISDVYVYMYQMPSFLDITSFVVFLGYQMSMYICTKCHYSQILLHLLFSWNIRCLCIYVPNAIIPRYYFICCFLGIPDVYVYMYQMPLFLDITSFVVFLEYQMSMYICTKCHYSQILLHLLFSWNIRCLSIYVPNAIIPRYYFICCFLGISDVYVYMYQMPSFLDITSFVVFLGYQMSMYICTKCHYSQILLHLLFSWNIRCLCIYVPNAIIPRYYFICCFLGISDVYVYMYQMPLFLDITSFVVFLGYQMSMYICTKCHYSQILLHLLFSWDIRCLCIYVPNAIIPRYYFICCFLGISDVYVYMYQMPSFLDITSFVVFLEYQMSMYICTKCHYSQILLHLLFSWNIRCLSIYVPNAIIPRYYFICCFLGISDVYVYMYQMPSFLDITSFVVFLGYQMSMYICTKCHYSQILLHLLFSWNIRCLCIYVPNAIIPRYYFICCFLGIPDVYVYMYQMPLFLDITSFVVFLEYQMSMYICTKCHYSQILLHLLFSWNIRCLSIYVPNAIIPRYYFICCFLGNIRCLCIYVPNAIILRYYFICCFLGISDVYVYMYQMPLFLDITSFVVFLEYQMSMYICTKCHYSQILLHLLFSWDIRCLCIYVPNAIIPRYYFICCFLGISDVYVYMYQMPLFLDITSFVVFLGYQMSMYICTKCHHSQILLHLLFSWNIRCLCIYVPNAIIPRYYFICCFLGISDV